MTIKKCELFLKKNKAVLSPRYRFAINNTTVTDKTNRELKTAFNGKKIEWCIDYLSSQLLYNNINIINIRTFKIFNINITTSFTFIFNITIYLSMSSKM